MGVTSGSPQNAPVGGPAGTAPAGPNLRALKILVVVMGIAIIASVIVIIVAISNRLSDAETAAGGGASPAAPTAAVAPVAPATAIGDLSIAIPEGCVIAEASAEGPRLILRFDGLAARGCQQVVLIDLESGTVLGRVTATPGG